MYKHSRAPYSHKTPHSHSLTSRQGISTFLILAGLLLALFAPSIANGRTQAGLLQFLADSYVGVYHKANAIKLLTGESAIQSHASFKKNQA